METERELPGVRTRSSFICTVCGAALTEDDFVALDLRPPEPGETLDEYAEAELVDAIVHRACAKRRGGA